MPDNLLTLVALSLASWRAAVFLIREDGPWLLARRIRTLAGVQHDGDGEPVGIPESMPGAVFGCMYCMSVWTAAAMLALSASSGAGAVLVIVLAVSGAAVLMESVVGRLNRG